MARPASAGLAACAVLAVVALGCAPSPSEAGVSLTLADGSTALTWGDGEYGVVLVVDEGEAPEDWAALATEIAANRMTVVAPDKAGVSADRLAAAAASLTDGGIERVAYVASGAQGGTLVAALAESGGVVDQLILVSGDLTGAQLVGLGEPPKLFVAAEGDATGAAAAEAMTDAASGTWNDLLLVPGSSRGAQILAGDGADELISGVVARLEERR
jgi:hypothetical protein